MDKHPSKDIIATHGIDLKGKRIVLCITASVAAYKAVDLARLLMRHGAEVYAVMSKKASMLITPELMHWATGNKVVTKLTQDLEHIRLADYDRSDLIIIYPCTANTISKIASGIDDTPVTSIASVALGSKIPIIIAPAMHEAMYNNPILVENISKLSKYVKFVMPNMVEGKAKVAEQEIILDEAIRILSNHKLKGKKVLVTAGSTVEYIDPIRVITSKASGRFGVAIARVAYRLGADVTLVYAHGNATIPNNINLIKVDTSKDMLDAIVNEVKKGYDIAIMTAAVADYMPIAKMDRKIDTRSNPMLSIDLKQTEKIIDKVKDVDDKIFLVAFKALYKVSKEELIREARKKMREARADMVFANDIYKVDMGSEDIEGYIVDDGVRYIARQSKLSAARVLLDHIASKL